MRQRLRHQREAAGRGPAAAPHALPRARPSRPAGPGDRVARGRSSGCAVASSGEPAAAAGRCAAARRVPEPPGGARHVPDGYAAVRRAAEDQVRAARGRAGAHGRGRGSGRRPRCGAWGRGLLCRRAAAHGAARCRRRPRQGTRGAARGGGRCVRGRSSGRGRGGFVGRAAGGQVRQAERRAAALLLQGRDLAPPGGPSLLFLPFPRRERRTSRPQQQHVRGSALCGSDV